MVRSPLALGMDGDCLLLTWFTCTLLVVALCWCGEQFQGAGRYIEVEDEMMVEVKG